MYIPTNHLYLGDVFFIPEEKVVRLDMPVEQAIRLLMSGGDRVPAEVPPVPPPGERRPRRLALDREVPVPVES